ncbi:hypothetical protein MRB53_006714 [Persea americana]|uniref:Uncharacterized protein n=1 Tax=Persea americana TaxID=3435 RepID=A0ACC2MGR0_PERAE|nr:hypothetical protein MRB53_006714 [Persea americana]
MIFFKKDPISGFDLETIINNAVFPGLQVVSNCKALAAQLIELGYNLFSGGSDNHLVLGHQWSSTLLLVPGGIRIGTPAMTTRGFKEKDFIAAAGFIHEGVQIALEAKGSISGTMLKDFLDFVQSPEFSLGSHISDLKRES